MLNSFVALVTNPLSRKLLRRGNFSSVEDLKTKVLAFIDYYNRTMAKPFKWTYQDKPLAASLQRHLGQPVLVLVAAAK